MSEHAQYMIRAIVKGASGGAGVALAALRPWQEDITWALGVIVAIVSIVSLIHGIVMRQRRER